MDNYDDRIKLDIFKFQTTYQNDFKRYPPTVKATTSCQKQLVDVKPPEKSTEVSRRDNETFAMWRKNVDVPFDLLWRPKEILQTDPYEPFATPVVPKDKEKTVAKTPLAPMSPAVSMDDIEDPNVRKLLCNYMYTSELTKAIQESAVRPIQRDVPNTTAETDGDPVRLKVDLLPPVPANFRNKGKEWENKQLRAAVDPTKTFWEYKDPPVKCGACNDPVEGLVSEVTKQEIRDLISKNKLRLVHDEPMPGYAGYKPRFSGQVSLAKHDKPVEHPLMSVTEAITKRYESNK